MIKVITQKDSLPEVKEEWNRIFALDPKATPFQKFDYLLSSLSLGQSVEESLYIIMIKENAINQWIAIFPFCLDKKGVLRFVNARHSDFCAPIIMPEYNDYNLYAELSEYIEKEKNIKGAVLQNVMVDNQLAGVLKPHFRYMITHDMNFYSSIPITPRADDKDSISAFKYVRAKQRKLRKSKQQIGSNCTFEILRTSDGKEYPQKAVDSLVEQMLKDGIRAKSYFSDEMLTFWRNLYESGVLCAALLYENGEIRTCNFMCYDEKRNEYIKWIMLYRENSWNMKINIMIADHIYHHGGGVINFARGIYDYKLINFHPDVKPLFCVKIAKTKWGHFRNIVDTAFHYLKPIVKSWLRR